MIRGEDFCAHADESCVCGASQGLASLDDAVAALIRRHGLEAVYECVRERDGFCQNCGCLETNGTHLYIGLGRCEIVRSTVEDGVED